jgi:hypothetical protein
MVAASIVEPLSPQTVAAVKIADETNFQAERVTA